MLRFPVSRAVRPARWRSRTTARLPTNAAADSGERLRSEATATQMKLGLGDEYRWGRYMLGGAASASGPGSDDSVYTANLRFGMRF